jgi:hypothetical protein
MDEVIEEYDLENSVPEWSGCAALTEDVLRSLAPEHRILFREMELRSKESRASGRCPESGAVAIYGRRLSIGISLGVMRHRRS